MAGALDWGWNGLVLYGCHQVVVAVDPESLQVLQTFHGHAAPVIRVRWYDPAHVRPLTRRRADGLGLHECRCRGRLRAPQDTSLAATPGSPCTFASADAAGAARDAGSKRSPTCI